MKKIILLSLLFFSLNSSTAQADKFDFGGHVEKFKGAGDKIPPACQIGIPRASTTAFTIYWNCTDDNADPQDIRTELWMTKKGSPTSEKIAEFLGFPAAKLVDEKLLGVATFTDGLPAVFRLVAIDKAGITAMSPYLSVRQQDNSIDSCTLNVETEAGESDGSTVTTAMKVTVTNAPVTSAETSTSSMSVATKTQTEADPCEISSLCSDDNELTFNSTVSLGSGTEATGTIVIQPGSIQLTTEGTYTVEDSVLTELELIGTTTIDTADANVTLKCKKN